MTLTRYRAALIGCGRIGVTMEEDPRRVLPATHAGAYQACPRTEFVAVVDVDRDCVDRAARLFPEVRGFTSVDAMLDTVRPDIVSIATPQAQHRSGVEACARGGVRAVVCEKPIADSLDDARAMIEACAKSRTLLLINHTRRFDPVIRQLRDRIAAGALGEITQATAYYTAGVFNSGTHMVDLMRFFLGDAAWVIALGNPAVTCPPGDFSADALLGFTSGARAALQVQEVKDYAIFTLRLHGRAGTAVIDRFGFEMERTSVRDCAEFSGYRELDVNSALRHGEARSFMTGLVDHAVACLDGREKPVSRGEDGLAALEILLAIKASSGGGGSRVALTLRGNA
jgi:predicted dehydrogenase